MRTDLEQIHVASHAAVALLPTLTTLTLAPDRRPRLLVAPDGVGRD